MYNCFTHNSKQAFKASKLANLPECKGNKNLKNIKTCWVSMLSPSKWVLNEYKTLDVKMATNSVAINITKVNHELLCDVEMLLGLACIIPLLKLVQSLSKFAQDCETFICNFVAPFKLANTASTFWPL